MTPATFETWPDLASERLGGAVIWANDEFFAEKENLVREAPAVWKEGVYTDRGKWMDGWETRRHRAPDHDRCILRLGLPGRVRGVVVDTAFFRGNFPEAAALEGCVAPVDATPEWLEGPENHWFEVLPRVVLQGDHKNRFPIDLARRVTHLRLRIFPDGGVARLRVHGEVLPDLADLRRRGELDLAGLEVGGVVVGASDWFFSPPQHLLLPGPSRGMHDGWESRRRRGPGHDHAVIRLGLGGEVRAVEVDTAFFRGNFPKAVAVDLADLGSGEPTDADWVEVVPEHATGPHTRHQLPLAEPRHATHARLRIYPDGGVARLRVYGRPGDADWRDAGVRGLDHLDPAALSVALRRCCHSAAWVDRVLAAGPYRSWDGLLAACAAAEAGLGREDWLEAFSGHPAIGESRPASDTHRWSAQEQAGMGSADALLRARMADGNRRYRERFGYTYIVCATGRSAAELVALLDERLGNPPEQELLVAAGQQALITRIRLEKLVLS